MTNRTIDEIKKTHCTQIMSPLKCGSCRVTEKVCDGNAKKTMQAIGKRLLVKVEKRKRGSTIDSSIQDFVYWDDICKVFKDVLNIGGEQ